MVILSILNCIFYMYLGVSPCFGKEGGDRHVTQSFDLPHWFGAREMIDLV
ncbi:hypothetical protein SAMN05518683_1411, partial [Salibacterium halotolerans]